MAVTLVIILSKAVGFLRETVVAGYFGTSVESDAFLSAYSVFYIPVLLLNSCITSTLVPMYVEARERKGIRRANRFGSNTINMLALASLLLAALMFLFAKPLVHMIYADFPPEKVQLTARLARIMMLTLTFNIASIAMASLLNAREKYISAQLTGFPLSIAVMIAAAVFSKQYGVEALAWGVFAANVLQALVLVPPMRGWFSYSSVVNFRDKRLHRLVVLAAPAVLAMAVSELSHLVDQWMASAVDGDISALNYGYKVITLLTGVIIVPLTTIMFSRMSKLAVANDRRGVLEIVRRSTVLIALVMLPVTAIASVLGADVIKALYMNGRFDSQSVAVTTGVFICYVVGIIAFGIRDLLNRAYHAMQDTKTTMWVSVLILFLNLGFNFLLRWLMGVKGLALATSISGSIGTVVLFFLLRKKLRHLGMRQIVPDVLKICLASAAGAAVSYFVGRALPEANGRMFAIVRLLAAGGAGLLAYLAAGLLVGITPFKDFLNRRGNANDGRGEADHNRLPGRGRPGRAVAPAPDAFGVLRAGEAQEEPERLHAGGRRKARAAGPSAAVRPSGARKDDARGHHRAGDGAQHTHHQRPRD